MRSIRLRYSVRAALWFALGTVMAFSSLSSMLAEYLEQIDTLSTAKRMAMLASMAFAGGLGLVGASMFAWVLIRALLLPGRTILIDFALLFFPREDRGCMEDDWAATADEHRAKGHPKLVVIALITANVILSIMRTTPHDFQKHVLWIMAALFTAIKFAN